jgi:hypothetical protein
MVKASVFNMSQKPDKKVKKVDVLKPKEWLSDSYEDWLKYPSKLSLLRMLEFNKIELLNSKYKQTEVSYRLQEVLMITNPLLKEDTITSLNSLKSDKYNISQNYKNF